MKNTFTLMSLVCRFGSRFSSSLLKASVFTLGLSFLFFSNLSAQITMTATAGNMGPSNYTTLKEAFDRINDGTHQGAVTILLTGDTNEGTATALLNASGTGSASYTSVLISPTGGGARTITGATTAAFPMIDLNGADNVTFDGLNSGGNALTISNTTASATALTSTIRLLADATNNTITNCSVLGSFSGSAATNGGNIYFAAGSLTTGNDNNTISNCNIGPAGSNLPTKGIYSNGTTTAGLTNTGNIIDNNNIFDYFGAAVTSGGIYLAGGTSDITITNNRFYQTAARTHTTGAQHSAIWINSTSGNNHLVSGNTIGYAASNGTGVYTLNGIASSTFVPIFLSVGTTTATSVQENTITAISFTGAFSGTTSSGPFRGIYVSSGLTTIGDVNGNTVGNMAGTGAITISSSSSSTMDVLAIFNNGSSAWTVSNNNIGGITVSNTSTGAAKLFGIYVNTLSSVNATVSFNSVGSGVANSLQSTTTATASQVTGIYCATSNATVTGNLIQNLSAAGGTGTTTSSSVLGIGFVSTLVNNTVTSNTIQSLSNSNPTAATIVTGIQYTSTSGANLIAGNYIHGLTNASNSATAEVNGIRVSSGTATYRNNMIAVGAGTSNAIIVNGIFEVGGTNNFWHNSVYVGGAPTAGAANSYAFQSTVTTNTRSYRDNIFFNARSNSGATGKNYSVRVGGTTPNPAGLTINNNIYFANGTGAVFGFFNSLDVADLAAWRTAVGQDIASFEINPQYADPGNATPNLHLHPINQTAAESNGFDVGVTDDFDGEIRATLTPVDIGADAGNYASLPLMTFVSCTTTQNNTSNAFTNTPNQEIIGIQVVTSGVVNALSLTSFNLNTNGSTATGDISNAKIFYTGTTSTFSPTGQFGSTFNSPNGNFVISGTQVLSAGTNYFWLTYDVSCAATPGNVIDAECTSLDVSGPRIPSVTAPAGSRTLVNGPLSGTITVGTTGTYTSLESAIADVNSKGLSGNVTLQIQNNLTIASPISINQWTECNGSGFTLTISPAAGTAVTLSGTSGVGLGALIKLNGADRVIFDGLNTGGASMTIENTSTTAGTAVIWLASQGAGLGATNNSISNCNIKAGVAQNAATTVTYGIVVAGNTLGATATTISAGDDNDNTTITGNTITKARYGVYIRGGSAANPNTGTSITNNIVGAASFGAESVGKGGIIVREEDGIIISNNTIRYIGGDYDNTSGGADRVGIGLGTDAAWTIASAYIKNAIITRNTIHNIIDERTFSAVGIAVGAADGANATNNLVANNMIYNIKANGTGGDQAVGIGLTAGNGDKIVFNSIFSSGDTDPNAGATTPATSNFGISITSGTAVTNPTIKNNIVYFNLSSSSAPLLKSANINVPTSYAWGTGASNNNDFYFVPSNTQANTGCVGGSGGTFHLTLANWQSATLQDAASYTEDPMFLSGTDLHINTAVGSIAEGTGTPIAGVTTDFDQDIRNVTTPDIGADEMNGIGIPPMVFVSCTATQGNVTAVPSNTTNQEILGLQVVTSGGLNPLSATSFTLNTNGTTLPGDITNAKLWFTGSNATFGTPQQFGSTIAAPSGSMMFTATQVLGTGTNYFWLTYDVPCSATPGNLVDAEFNSVTVGSPQVPTTQAPAGSRTIQTGPLAGTFTVGTGGTYATLEAAIADINTKGLSGNTTLSILNSHTIAPMSINQWVECPGSGFTLTISPAAGQAVVLTGTTASTLTGLIKLNGADRVTIDGLNTGGASLTIENTSTTSGNAVIWISSLSAGSGASNNTIRNCTLKGGIAQNAASGTVYGVVMSGATLSGTATSVTAGNDNDNNTITGNTIIKVRYGVYVRGGSTTNPNTGTIISNNIIGPASFGVDEIGRCGILVREESGIQVTGNRVRCVGGDFANGFAGSTDRVGIAFATDGTWPSPTSVFVKSAIIANNKISDIVDEQTFSAVGIVMAGVDGTNATTNYMVNNMIWNIKANGTSSDQAVGIAFSAGKDDAAVFNSIYLYGDTDPDAGATATTEASFGISIGATAVNNPFIKDNIVYNNLTSSSTPAQKNASINIPTGYTWTANMSDFNDFYVNPSNTQANVGCVGGTAGTFYAALNLWTTAVNQDASSVNIDPMFTSPTDLHIDFGNNAINNLGTPVAGVTVDIDNETRDVATPDIGADEFTPTTCVTAVGGSATGSTSFCNSGTPNITASGYSFGAGSAYQWKTSTNSADYPNAGTDVPGQTTPSALMTGLVTQTTYYWLRVTCGTNSSTDYSNMITITVHPSLAGISGPAAKCDNEPAVMLTENGGTGISWLWSTGATTQSISVNPGMTTTYTVTVTSTGACTATASKSVTVNPAPTVPIVDPISICNGSTGTLTVTNPQNDPPVVGSKIGSGTLTTSIPGPYRRFYEAHRFQMLYTAAELSASGLQPGLLSSLAFYVNSVPGGNTELANVEIKLKNTSITSMTTTFETGTTLVYTAATYQPIVGINIHMFNGAPFSWDGTSNVLVEFCFVDDDGQQSSTTTEYTSITGSVLGYAEQDNPNVCSVTIGEIDTERPNIRFTQPGAVATYTWNPGALTGTSVMVSPTSNTTYTVISSFPETGCTNSSTVEVTVIDLPTITLGANPTVCQGTTTADLPYSGTTGSPNQYSINYDGAAEAQGFTDVSNASLPASPIVLTVPGAAALGTYNGILTVRNSSTTCVSTTYPITVTIDSGPNAGTISGVTPLCVNATATYSSNGDPGGMWTSTNTSVATVHSTSGLVTAVAPGTSNITYTVTSGSCSASNFQTVTVDPVIVTNTNDSGPGSLRDIIGCAGDGATITIDAALTGQTITLTLGQIQISKNLTIVGLGAVNLSISGNNFSRIFHVLPGKTLNLQGMTLKDCFTLSNGGAVWVEGYLILNNVTIQNCFENGVPKSLTLSNPSNLDVIGTVEMKN